MDTLHEALKTEIQESRQQGGVEFVLVKLQRSKTEVAFSLHVRPSSFSLSGLQTTDVLGQLGFQPGQCSFVVGEQCYAKAVAASFDVQGFAAAFERAYGDLLEANRHLEACGLGIRQTEGWTFFTGRPHDPRTLDWDRVSGDGHTSPKRERMRQAEDDAFAYVLTWVEGGRDKGWTTHYRAKHLPLSAEVESILVYLGLRAFRECPEFDFDPCHWRFTAFRQTGDIFGTNAEYACRWFHAHAEHFSAGIAKLLSANAAVEPFGMALLPGVRANVPPSLVQPLSSGKLDRERPLRRVSAPTRLDDPHATYDVAISFAGPQRPLAERLATLVRDAGHEVFYDGFYPEQLWGKDLAVFFDRVFRLDSRYCVIFVSADYVERPWTNHERRSAVARLISERGSEYVLPVRVDASDLPGVAPTIGYLSLDEYSIEQVAEILLRKLVKAGKV